MKYFKIYRIDHASRSLPSWERGLKYTGSKRNGRNNSVAPLVGAWIEINASKTGYVLENVAPLVGAWIEIDADIAAFHGSEKSLPSWERGLKLLPPKNPPPPISVAPLVGAWSEIFTGSLSNRFTGSLPSWERGLKYPYHDRLGRFASSLPSWERGLKYIR